MTTGVKCTKVSGDWYHYHNYNNHKQSYLYLATEDKQFKLPQYGKIANFPVIGLFLTGTPVWNIRLM